MKPYKPNKPIRGMIEDFRCFERNEDCVYKGGCENCDEREDCEGNGFEFLRKTTLQNLVQAYGEYDFKDIEISSVCMYSDNTSLVIRRPETDEEFAIKMEEYEKELKIYNDWMEDNTPEKRKQKAEAKKLAKLAKLKKETELLEKEMNK